MSGQAEGKDEDRRYRMHYSAVFSDSASYFLRPGDSPKIFAERQGSDFFFNFWLKIVHFV